MILAHHDIYFCMKINPIFFLFSLKKSRSVKTTTAQYEELVKYMESHSEFATNKYVTKDGKIHHAQQWEQLAGMLNALTPGNDKTSKQWQTVSI